MAVYGKGTGLVGFDFNPGDAQWAETLADLQKVTKRISARPILLKIAAHIREETKRNFDSEGAYAGDRWAPNSEPYGAWKRGERRVSAGGHVSWMRPAKDSRVLHRYLELRRALTIKAHPEHVETITKHGRRLVVGVKGEALKVAAINRDGERGRVPARDPFAFRPGFNRKVYDMIENYLYTGYLPSAGSL